MVLQDYFQNPSNLRREIPSHTLAPTTQPINKHSVHSPQTPPPTIPNPSLLYPQLSNRPSPILPVLFANVVTKSSNPGTIVPAGQFCCLFFLSRACPFARSRLKCPLCVVSGLSAQVLQKKVRAVGAPGEAVALSAGEGRGG